MSHFADVLHHFADTLHHFADECSRHLFSVHLIGPFCYLLLNEIDFLGTDIRFSRYGFFRQLGDHALAVVGPSFVRQKVLVQDTARFVIRLHLFPLNRLPGALFALLENPKDFLSQRRISG